MYRHLNAYQFVSFDLEFKENIDSSQVQTFAEFCDSRQLKSFKNFS